MDDDAVLATGPPVCASTDLEACSLPAAIDRADPPLWVWRAPDGTARLGTGEAARITADGATRFGTIEDALEALTDGLPTDRAGPAAFVGARFHHEAPSGPSAWDPYPSTVAAVPRTQLRWHEDARVTLTVVADDDADLDARLERERARFAGATAHDPVLPGVTAREHHPQPAAWQTAVERIAARLATPPPEKAVLAGTCRLDLESRPSRGAVVDALASRHPGCWTFLFAPTATSAFVGATPERLATVDGDRLETVALAGSVGRGDTGAADAALRNRLLEREALRREQASVVADIVGRLGPLSETVRVADRQVRTLTDVQHIETPIEATLRDGVGLLGVVDALHPTPAVGGRPRASALALVREVEAIERGWYAAPIGVVDAAGDGTLAVGIRSARLDGTTATLFAGNGIVPASDPDEEWQELLLKFRAMGGIFDG